MRRPPRPVQASLFEPAQLLRSIAQGLILTLVLLALYAAPLHGTDGGGHARALAFASLIAASLALIFANRSWSRAIGDAFRGANSALWWVVAGALVILGLALNVPILRAAFRFAPLHLMDVLILVIVTVLGFLIFRGINFLRPAR